MSTIFIRDGLKYYTARIGFTTFQIDFRYQNLTPQSDGSYGCVVSAYDTLMQRMVVIKKIKNPLSQVQDMKRVLREIKLLRHFVGHENITSIYDIMTDPPDTPEFEDLYIVTNLFESDLGHIIKTTGTSLTNHHYQFFLFQIFRALKFIHSANVIHRDLKPSSLLVTAECDLSVCDFGLGRGVYHTSSQEPLTQNAGTRWYRAPEVLCQSNYGIAADMWSVGCIFAEMLTGTPFFKGDNSNQQLKSILNRLGCPPVERLNFIKSRTALSCILNHKPVGTLPRFDMYFPEGTSFIALDLLRRMLMFNPGDRIAVNEALNHPYIKIFNDKVSAPSCLHPFNFNLMSLSSSSSNHTVRFADSQNIPNRQRQRSASSMLNNNNNKEDTSNIDVLAAVSAMMALSHTQPSPPSLSSEQMMVEKNTDADCNTLMSPKDSFYTNTTSEYTTTDIDDHDDVPLESSSYTMMTMKEARLLILGEVIWYRPMSLNIASYLVSQQHQQQQQQQHV